MKQWLWFLNVSCKSALWYMTQYSFHWVQEKSKSPDPAGFGDFKREHTFRPVQIYQPGEKEKGPRVDGRFKHPFCLPRGGSWSYRGKMKEVNDSPIPLLSSCGFGCKCVLLVAGLSLSPLWSSYLSLQKVRTLTWCDFRNDN